MQQKWFASFVLIVVTLIASHPGFAVQPEPPAQVLARAIAAQGIVSPNVRSVSQGRLILYSLQTPKAEFDVTIWRDGIDKVQRVIKQGKGEVREGSDGTRHWKTIPAPFQPKETPVRVVRFIESQTVRSIHALAGPAAAASLREIPSTPAATAVKKGRGIEVTDTKGRTTSYFIDPATSLITRIEFPIGKAKNIFGQEETIYETYLFSEFQTVQGQKTPFKIERFEGGIKTEEMQFSSVSFNAVIPANVFQPK